jgi:hypothetical protein
MISNRMCKFFFQEAPLLSVEVSVDGEKQLTTEECRALQSQPHHKYVVLHHEAVTILHSSL